MKINKFNEDKYVDNDTIIKIRSLILDWVDLEDVPYTDDVRINKKSVDEASIQIYNMLVDDGINFEELKNIDKYNL